MFLYPNECIGPTFVDGGDLDLNTLETSVIRKAMAVLYNNDVLAGAVDDPPDRLCPPCQTPFACKTFQDDAYTKIATRFGVLTEPWRILMRICYVEVRCGEDPPEMKYVLESRYDYMVAPMFQKYIHQTSSSTMVSGGCCTGSSSVVSNPPHPDTTDPDFWGYPSGFPECLDADETQSISFSRYKIYDDLEDLVAGELVFDNTDIPDCLIGGIPPEETDVICLTPTVASDPTFGSTTIDCTPDPVVSVDCTVKWLHPCNSLWYSVDPVTGDITCSPFDPRPVFPDTVCGPATYTIKSNNPLSPPLCGTDFAPTFPAGVDASCLSEPSFPCIGSWVRYASGWVTYDLFDVNVFCSGGSSVEICVDAPIWTVDVS